MLGLSDPYLRERITIIVSATLASHTPNPRRVSVVEVGYIPSCCSRFGTASRSESNIPSRIRVAIRRCLL